MRSLSIYMYAALLAFTTLNFAPTTVSAQESARGKFTLSHSVHWQNAVVPAGEYEFWFQSDGARVLWLNKLSGPRTSFMFLVSDEADSKPADVSRIVLQSTPAASYVSAMQLPEFGMTLRFTVPSSITEKQIAKAGTTPMASVQ